MPRHERVAARYAKAVFEYLAGDSKKTRTVLDELAVVAKLTASHADLAKLFTTELFPVPRRREVVEDLAKKLKLSDDSTKILIVLSNARRLGLLPALIEMVHLLELKSASVIPLHVESAGDLSKDEREKIEKKFSQILGKQVEANYVLDPLVIGGLRVTANGRTYDGSISGWLMAIREQLAAGSV